MPFYRLKTGIVHMRGTRLPAPCNARTLIDGIAPVPHYRELVQRYAAPRLRAPFNTAARQQAGFTDEELAALTAGT